VGRILVRPLPPVKRRAPNEPELPANHLAVTRGQRRGLCLIDRIPPIPVVAGARNADIDPCFIYSWSFV